MLSARKVILPEIIYNHPIMKLHFPWALDLIIWQGYFTDMLIPALLYRRFAFVTKLLLPRFRKLLKRRALSGNFAILKVKGASVLTFKLELSTCILMACWNLATEDWLTLFKVQHLQVKSRQEMQEKGKRIRSYQLDGPKFFMLFCSRENRQENVLDSTD